MAIWDWNSMWTHMGASLLIEDCAINFSVYAIQCILSVLKCQLGISVL